MHSQEFRDSRLNKALTHPTAGDCGARGGGGGVLLMVQALSVSVTRGDDVWMAIQ